MKSKGVRWFLSLAVCLSIEAAAQSFPSKPIRMIVPYAPGGPTDVIARIVAARMSQKLGQAIVVENKPGASGIIGTEAAALSPPDGYTILLTLTRAPDVLRIGPQPKYDLSRDFDFVSSIASVPNVLVANPSAPYKSVTDLIRYAKANPGTLKFGAIGAGSLSYFMGEEFRSGAGVEIANIPYRDGAQAVPALIGREVDLQFAPLSSVMSFLKSGKVRPLAVADSRRSALLPDVPTMREAGGPAVDGSSRYALFAPKGIPAAALNRLRLEASDALRDPGVKENLAGTGAEPLNVPGESLMAEMKADQTRWAIIVHETAGPVAAATKDFSVYVYAHTHAAHGACSPKAMLVKPGAKPPAWNPTIINTGAWQRLVTPAGLDGMRKTEPGKVLSGFTPEALPACYSTVIVPAYQPSADGKPGTTPRPAVWFWRQDGKGDWDFDQKCDKDPGRLPVDGCAG